LTQVAATYYDGRSAAAHAMTVHAQDRELLLCDRHGEIARWPLSALVFSESSPDGVVFVSCKNQPGRAAIADAVFLRGLGMRGGGPDRFRLSFWAALGAAALLAAAIAIDRLPVVAARLVPTFIQSRLGQVGEDALMAAHHRCTAVEGQQSLDRLTSRLAQAAELNSGPGAQAMPIGVIVIDDPRINAVALPGNRIVVMRGLIDRVEDPDEFAGVLAHETAHLAHHDPMRAVLRRLGLKMIVTTLGLGNGIGDVAPLAGALLNLSYSRQMEDRADAAALTYLTRAGLKSDGLARFFAMLEKREDKNVIGFLADHPPTEQRRLEHPGSAVGASAMTVEQWKALQGICRST
jgi:Zn-dependent protease with chaperone function